MFTKPIPDVTDSIERPIIYGVTRDLVENGILPDPEDIQYQPITKTVRKDKDEGVRFKVDGILTIEVETTPTEGMNVPTALLPNREGENPAFLDTNLEIAIFPIYYHVTNRITYRYSSSSLNELRTWERAVRASIMASRDRFVHTLEYGFTPPSATFKLLNSIHKLTEEKAGYGDDFSTFLKKRAVNSMVVIATEKHEQLSVACTQESVIGYLEEAGKVTISEASEGQYVGEMSYRFNYDLPESLKHIYPIQVHQKLLPNEFLPIALMKNKVLREVKGPLAVSHLLGSTGSRPVITIPPFDNNRVGRVHIGYQKEITILIQSTGEDDEILFNLLEVPDLCLEPWVICYMQSQYQYLQQPYKTHLLVSLHEEGELMDMTFITVDEDLNIRLNKPLNLRANYHITISLVTSLESLTRNIACAIEDNCSDYAGDMLEAVVSAIKGSNSEFTTRREVTLRDFTNKCRTPLNLPKTVQEAYVETYRYNQLKED